MLSSFNQLIVSANISRANEKGDKELKDIVRGATAMPMHLKEYGLTRVELHILYLTMQGYSAKQIAKQRNRSFRTVEKHLENIKDKLCCISKYELILVANQNHFEQMIPDEIRFA